MKIDMVSEHGSPLAELGGPGAGGQNVRYQAEADTSPPSRIRLESAIAREPAAVAHRTRS